jgi:hypothetical protein
MFHPGTLSFAFESSVDLTLRRISALSHHFGNFANQELPRFIQSLSIARR